MRVRGVRRLACLGALWLALVASPARAAVFLVNSISDSLIGVPANCPAIDRALPPNPLPLGACTLRDAVAAANARAGDDEIVFNFLGVDRITLGSALEIEETLDINAPAIPGIQVPLRRLVLVAGPGVTQLLEVADGETVLGNVVLEDGNLDILMGNLVFEQASDATFAENISGAGSLEKDGAAKLTLTGTNVYAGGTTVSQGILQGDTLSIPGDTLISSGARLVFDQGTGDPEIFAGHISGAGSVEKIGAGTLELSVSNTYTGGTTITAGKLVGFAAGAFSSLQGDILNNAQLVFEQTAAGSFADDITGSGSVEKTGLGTLTLAGANSFGGGLTISQGVVIGSTRSIPGSVLLASGSQLIFDQENPDATPLNGTHSGSITGGGGLMAGEYTLIKRGAGTLTLAGNNSYVGGTLVEEGALQGSTQSLQGDISLFSAATSLIFSQSSSGTYSGVIDGAGDLFKRGTGTVSFTQSQALDSLLTTTAVEAGRLEIGVSGQGDGAGTTLPGGVNVSAGATLAGIGIIGGAVTANGALSPGGGVATLQVGSVSFGPGSVLEVDASDAGTDLLDVVGAAALGSSSVLFVDLGSVDRSMPFSETVLEAASISGTVFTIDQTFAFFSAAATQSSPTTIALELTPNGMLLPDFARTQNQEAVADALEQAFALEDPGDGMETDLEFVFGEIGGLQVDQIPEALDDMAGEQLTQYTTTRLAIADRFQASLQQRIRGVAWGDGEALIAEQGPDSGALSIAANPILARALPGLAQGFAQIGAQSMSSILDSTTGFQPAEGELGLGGWLDGYGLFGALSGDSGTSDLDYTIGGVSLGFDYRLARNWLLGAAGGYAHSDLDFRELTGSQSADTGQGALYGGYVTPWLQLGVSARYGYSAMDSSREIRFADRDADADFDGWDAGGRAEAALDLFELGGIEVQPLASFSYTHVQQDAIDESGADSLDLEVEDQSLDSLVSAAGARIHGAFHFDRELWFHPELQARWLHEFGDRDREISARIGGTPGAAYQVEGTQIPADSGVFGVGWTVVVAERTHLFVGYDVVVSSALLQHAVALGFKAVW